MRDSPSISNLVSTWDTSVAGVLNGRSTFPAHFDAWLGSLRHSYPQASATASLPEPFLGRLDRRPAAVFLAATAGRAYVGSHGRPDFQSLTGVFANEVRELGSYSAWAATWTYFRRPWTSVVSANGIHHRRLQFLRHWHGDDRLDAEDMVTFALYPWHTSGLTTRLRFDANLLCGPSSSSRSWHLVLPPSSPSDHPGSASCLYSASPWNRWSPWEEGTQRRPTGPRQSHRSEVRAGCRSSPRGIREVLIHHPSRASRRCKKHWRTPGHKCRRPGSPNLDRPCPSPPGSRSASSDPEPWRGLTPNDV